ncbi:MAG: hypothetical protein JXR83_02835, partial [Deltaproteobacteria bacterium]|nr:hypothetical protein [Deltaproteobacteria bacterium]
MRYRYFFMGAAIAALATACDDCGGDPTRQPGAGLPVSGPDGGSQVISCGVDDDCPFGQVCRAGLCQPSDPSLHDEGCWTDADCGAGYRCAASSGRCVLAAASPDAALPPAGECVTGTTRHCGTKVGLCDYGVEDCVAGHWSGTCNGGVRPTDELCDGLDNDCDGDSDETFELGRPCFNGLGVCRRPGLTVCSGDQRSIACNAVPLDATGRIELCGNAVDDDCDGEVDDGFEQLDAACSAGVGACLRAGTLICNDDLTALRCSAVAGTPAPVELCGNDVDDNCDGQTDEGFDDVVGTACAVGAPPCQTIGQWICSSDRTALECELPLTLVERCNGIDDNGDSGGCIDEGFPVGESCTVGQGICRASGVRVCSADELTTICGATPGAPDPYGELCGN